MQKTERICHQQIITTINVFLKSPSGRKKMIPSRNKDLHKE